MNDLFGSEELSVLGEVRAEEVQECIGLTWTRKNALNAYLVLADEEHSVHLESEKTKAKLYYSLFRSSICEGCQHSSLHASFHLNRYSRKFLFRQKLPRIPNPQNPHQSIHFYSCFLFKLSSNFIYHIKCHIFYIP